eukprot:8431481-Pyramimonas_sp.AAC.1
MFSAALATCDRLRAISCDTVRWGGMRFHRCILRPNEFGRAPVTKRPSCPKQPGLRSVFVVRTRLRPHGERSRVTAARGLESAKAEPSCERNVVDHS